MSLCASGPVFYCVQQGHSQKRCNKLQGDIPNGLVHIRIHNNQLHAGPASHNGREIQMQQNVPTRSIAVQMCQQLLRKQHNSSGRRMNGEQQGPGPASVIDQESKPIRFMRRPETSVQANMGALKTTGNKPKESGEYDSDLISAVEAFAMLHAAKRKNEEDLPSLKTRKHGRYYPVKNVVVDDVEMSEQPETRTVKRSRKVQSARPEKLSAKLKEAAEVRPVVETILDKEISLPLRDLFGLLGSLHKAFSGCHPRQLTMSNPCHRQEMLSTSKLG